MFSGFPSVELAARGSGPHRRVGAVDAPFIIYTAGRSRTAWLSAFLTYGDCVCHNEVAAAFRGWDEVSAFFSAGVGSAETGAAPAWRLFKHFVPNARAVVVRRDAEDIIGSFARCEISKIAIVDEEKLRKIVAYNERCLREISAQPGVLTVEFSDLEGEDACRSVFEHCLPYEFDVGWWRNLSSQNIQSDVLGIVKYYHEHIGEVSRFKRDSKRALALLARSGAIARHEDKSHALD